MGAVASNGIRVVNEGVIESLQISSTQLERLTEQERRQLRLNERVFRGSREPVPLRDRTVLLVDDGMATGATMRAAVKSVKADRPAEIVVAVPIATPEVCQQIDALVDTVECLGEVLELYSISQAYRDFAPVTDDEVRYILGGSIPARSTA
jgi:predicted phosphoribosyltransferase